MVKYRYSKNIRLWIEIFKIHAFLMLLKWILAFVYYPWADTRAWFSCSIHQNLQQFTSAARYEVTQEVARLFSCTTSACLSTESWWNNVECPNEVAIFFPEILNLIWSKSYTSPEGQQIYMWAIFQTIPGRWMIFLRYCFVISDIVQNPAADTPNKVTNQSPVAIILRLSLVH